MVDLNYQAKLDAAATPDATKKRAQDAADGIQAAANGKTPSDAQVQAGFATAATAAYALAAGVSLTAAGAVMGPIAAVVFGAGYGIGAAIQKALGIHNGTSQILACTSEDTSNGSDPSDPKWKTYAWALKNSMGVPTDQWQPATDGGFERWARPIIVRAIELSMNCKPLPGADTWRDWGNGLVAAWNAHAPKGTPMRSIPYTYPADAGNLPGTHPIDKATRYARNADPVQQLIRAMFDAQWKGGAPRTGTPDLPREGDPTTWSIQVADIPAGVPVHLVGAFGRRAPVKVNLTGIGRAYQSERTKKVLVGSTVLSIIAGVVSWAFRRRSS